MTIASSAASPRSGNQSDTLDRLDQPRFRILRVVQDDHDVGETRILQTDFVDRNPGFDILVHGLQPLEMLGGLLPGEPQSLRERQHLVCSRTDLRGKYLFRIVHRNPLRQRSAYGAFPVAVNYQKCKRQLPEGGRTKEERVKRNRPQTGPTVVACAQPPPAHPGPSTGAGLSAPLVLRSRDARPQLRRSARPAVREVSSKKMKTGRTGKRAASRIPEKENSMHIMKVDPRSLKDNPDNTRQSKSTPQADALLLATIKAVGIIQPPVIFPEVGGGNSYVIESGHRRTRMAIAAGLEEIEVLVVEAANDNGAMRSMVENIAREPLNRVDQWRGIERLIALDWTEEAIAVALALPVRQIRKLRLLANVLPAMLDQMALGDMPNEQQVRTIAAAHLDEQKEVWKAQKPKKGQPAAWFQIANALNKTRMYAKDASFGDDLKEA